MTDPRLAALALAALATAGCADALVLTTRTSVGLRVTPAQNGQTEVDFAYDRQEFSSFPVKTRERDGKGPKCGAYSVFADLDVVNKWPIFSGVPGGELVIRQKLGTGKAAERLAGIEKGDERPCPAS